MASETCPCGCGRRVGFTKRGAAKGYVGCTTMLDNATPVVFEMMKSVDERDAAELGRTLENIDRIRGSFLRHVHGEARPGQDPDVLALSRAYQVMLDWYTTLGEDLGAF